MENDILQLQYALNTFYFLVCGALVMWMAAGFAMLEAGLVRSKNTVEILTKNVALFAISCVPNLSPDLLVGFLPAAPVRSSDIAIVHLLA